MAAGYRIVTWTPYKALYDGALALGCTAFVGAFIGVALATTPEGQRLSEVQLLIRASGACAFALLTLILAIGPLARLSPRFLPLLYNRRHLGVTCFLIASVHGGLTLLWYHGFSDLNPLISLLVSNPRYGSIQGFPFESLGLAAWFVLFAMAATSHDFWNAVLGPAVWKALHMAVYVAYALIVGHVMLGAVQGEKGLVYSLAVGAGAAALAALHIFAGGREARRDADAATPDAGWLRVGPGADIPDACARIVTPPQGEKIAVFRDGDAIFAVSNVCRHQGGPLGEGRLVDGCVTCPWHGFQYRPQDGRAPAPYTEKIATYRTRVEDGIVFVHETPMAPGAETPPSTLARPA